MARPALNSIQALPETAMEHPVKTTGGMPETSIFPETSPEQVKSAPEQQGVRYWALVADPKVYRIEEAIHQLAVDHWTTRGKAIRAGDRVFIWKAKSGGKHRGILALGEVKSNPRLMSDADNPFWLKPPDSGGEEQRVEVAYESAPGLPLWEGESPRTDDALAALSVSRARGGTVFEVTRDQWHAVLAAASEASEASSSMPSDSTASTADSEVEIVRRAVEAASGRQRGQGRGLDSERRQAVEKHAMDAATAHYEACGWKVEDVSLRCPYDLRCRSGDQELHVEVKGTITGGDSVLLTPNEVAHAREHYPHTALFVLARIEVRSLDGTTDAAGGVASTFQPWLPDDAALEPVGFEYTVPK